MIRIRPLDVVLGAMLIGAIGGYSAAKIGLDEKLMDSLERAADRRALRNANIMLDQAEMRAALVLTKVPNAAKG